MSVYVLRKFIKDGVLWTYTKDTLDAENLAQLLKIIYADSFAKTLWKGGVALSIQRFKRHLVVSILKEFKVQYYFRSCDDNAVQSDIEFADSEWDMPQEQTHNNIERVHKRATLYAFGKEFHIP